MKQQQRTAKESYRIRTHLIHGNHESKHWDFDHHLVPPISASAAYRLGSVHRGAQGFVVEEPYSMTHSALPAELKHARGLQPGGIRLSVGLENWHDIINDLEIALEQI
jgi:hypothetical protein